MIDLEFKAKQEDGTWKHVGIDEVAGKSLRQLFGEWDGKEVVVKVRKGIICGTQGWLDYYRKRGENAVSFPEALKMLEAKGETEALDVVFCRNGVEEHFFGARVASAHFDTTKVEQSRAESLGLNGGEENGP